MSGRGRGFLSTADPAQGRDAFSWPEAKADPEMEEALDGARAPAALYAGARRRCSPVMAAEGRRRGPTPLGTP
jgi:hypothetical protein